MFDVWIHPGPWAHPGTAIAAGLVLFAVGGLPHLIHHGPERDPGPT